MLALLSCTPNQYQQASEYDDVYFTSADRKTAPRVVAKTESAQAAEAANIITLSNESKQALDPNLIDRYNNNQTKEVEYFVAGEGGPRITKASELNYIDFLWDYENELLASYALPVDWADEWDELYFNTLVENDFEFRLAWYDQYYVGNSTRMDRYISASNARVARTSMSTFAGNGFGNRFGNNFGGGFWNRGINVSVGFGFGSGFGFYDPFFIGGGFRDPFYDPLFDPFFQSRVGFGFNRWNRWNRGWGFNQGWAFNGGFGNPYCPPIFSNRYIYRGEVIVANTRPATRSGRIASTSVTSVRSDAVNGVVPTRSQRLANAAGTSRVSRSAIANRSSAGGRISSSSSSRSGLSRSSVSRSSSSRSQVASTRSSRVSTDAYRFNDSRSSSRSSSSAVSSSAVRGSNRIVSSRSSRSSSNSTGLNSGRSSRSSTSRNSGLSFNRSSSRSTSSSNVRSSSSRSSSSRSSGSVSRSSGSSSRSSGSVSRSSGSSSRSSGSVSRSSGSSSRSSGSVSRSSSSSSSRSSTSSSGSRRKN